jgi:peptidoglycan/LPS O-acetylase OafA/YrhL
MACVVGPLFTAMPLSEYFSSKDVPLYVGRAVTFARHPSFTLPGVTFSQGPHGISVNGSLWTIPLEIRLYALTAIVALAAKYGRTPPLIVIAAVALLAYYVDLSAIIPNEDAYRLSWLFVSGAVLYIFRRFVPLHWSMAVASLAAWILLSKLSLAMSAMLLSYLTLYLAYLPRLAIPRFIDDFSYGIYLYAFPIQQVLSHTFPSIGPFRLMAMSVPLAWMAGWISWKLIEKPAISLKDRFLKKSIVSHVERKYICNEDGSPR